MTNLSKGILSQTWEKCQEVESDFIKNILIKKNLILLQKRIITKSERLGLIFVETIRMYKRACPAKRCLKINEEALKNIFLWNED